MTVSEDMTEVCNQIGSLKLSVLVGTQAWGRFGTKGRCTYSALQPCTAPGQTRGRNQICDAHSLLIDYLYPLGNRRPKAVVQQSGCSPILHKKRGLLWKTLVKESPVETQEMKEVSSQPFAEELLYTPASGSVIFGKRILPQDFMKPNMNILAKEKYQRRDLLFQKVCTITFQQM